MKNAKAKSPKTALNRTRMELKPPRFKASTPAHKALNRTRMELKPDGSGQARKTWIALNRTRMELKPLFGVLCSGNPPGS